MSKILDFTLKFGNSAKLRAMDNESLVSEMVSFGLNEEEVQAIIRKDTHKLAILSKCDSNIYCALFPENPDDQEDGQENDEEECCFISEKARLVAV